MTDPLVRQQGLLTRFDEPPPLEDGEETTGSGFDPAMIRGMLWRQRWIAISAAILGVVIGLVLTLLTTPIYTATATLRVNLQPQEIIAGQELTPVPGFNQFRSYMATLQSVIKSRATALRVVDRLNLVNDLDFIEADGPTRNRKQAEARRSQAAGKLLQSVNATSTDSTQIIPIQYLDRSPTLAAKIANGYVDALMSEDNSRSSEGNTYAQKILLDQVQKTRDLLQRAERQSIVYARANKIIALPNSSASSNTGSNEAANTGNPPGTAQTMDASSLAGLNAIYTDARIKRIRAEQRWLAVATMPVLSLGEAQQNPAIQNLINQRAQASATLADLRQRYREDYPQVLQALAQIKTIETQIVRSGGDLRASLKNEYIIAQKEEHAIAQERDLVSNSTLDEQDRRVQYNMINREVDSYKQQLEALMKRYNQVAASSEIRNNTISKLDDALPPSSPTSPNLIKNVGMSLAVGLAIGLIIGFLREILDDRMRSPQEVESKLGLRLLGVTPNVDEIDIIASVGKPRSALNEAYNSIRTTLDFVTFGKPHQVMMFTSSQEGEGKTLTAYSISRIYASTGKSVLLVDADLRRPSVARTVLGNSSIKFGLIDVLLSRKQLSEVVHRLPDCGLDVLPLGEIPPNPTELLSSSLIGQFLDTHRDKYDIIVLDCPPVMGLADSRLLARQADFVVFVIEANRAHFGQAKAAIRSLRGLGANLAGAVLSRFDARESGYYDYNYSYAYSSS